MVEIDSEALIKDLVVDTMSFCDCKLEVNYLAKMLSENSDCTSVKSEYSGITNEGLDTLAKHLCKNTTLETLNLVLNDVGFKNESPSKFTSMAEMLATNDKLKVLNLSINPLGSAGVTWIAEALESNKG